MKNIFLASLFGLSCTDCALNASSAAPVVSVSDKTLVVGDEMARAFVITGKTELTPIDESQTKKITDYMTAEWKQQTDIITCNYAEHFCATELKGKVRKAKESLSELAKSVGEKYGMTGVNILTCEKEDAVPYRCFVIGAKVVPLEEIVAPAQITQVITGAQWKRLQEQKQQNTKSQK